MDVSAIVTKLQSRSPTLFAQIIAPTTGGSHAPIATQANIYTLLQGLVSGEMYPLQLPESPTHPSIVYQRVSILPGIFEGYDITQTDTFVLSLRGADYDALIALEASVIAAFAGENIKLTDAIHDYDQEENLFRIHMEITYTYLAADAQDLPAAFVYPISRSGDPSVFDNYTKQRIEAQYAILIVTDDDNISALQDEIQASLLGWQQSAEHGEMEYGSGVSIEGVGGLSLWRETYRDTYYMQQA